VPDAVAELLGARLYEILRDKLKEQGVRSMEFTPEPLDAVRPAFVALALQLMTDAREERETWAREYIAAEAERLRAALTSSKDFVGRLAYPRDLLQEEREKK
jgi:hypothetical protein